MRESFYFAIFRSAIGWWIETSPAENPTAKQGYQPELDNNGGLTFDDLRQAKHCCAGGSDGRAYTGECVCRDLPSPCRKKSGLSIKQFAENIGAKKESNDRSDVRSRRDNKAIGSLVAGQDEAETESINNSIEQEE